MDKSQHNKPASLVVFSDDWGRHPSSCQHLVKRLLPEYKVLWVNTIGTRTPRFDMATVRRITEKLKQWFAKSNDETDDRPADVTHHNLTVVNPRMWPWFGRRLDRRINSWALSRQLRPLIERLPQPVTSITTLPITADLPGLLPVQKWLYYCVDDFSQWPGLDGSTLRDMDELMTGRADEIVAVSEHLQLLVSAHGRNSSILTHGVDLDHWAPASVVASEKTFQWPEGITGPTAVFWGVVDQRLDVDMLTALSQQLHDGTIVLIGPQQDPDERILNLPNVKTLSPQPFSVLPAIAQAANVLIMPYADLPVTRAMQPLKMKEYLATGRPVIVSGLPSVLEWTDCLDVAETADEFAAKVRSRIDGQIPEQQSDARRRLQQESWATKARQLELSLVPSVMVSASGKNVSEVSEGS